MDKVNLEEAFARIEAPWSPKIAGVVNGMHVKLVKLEGAFVWHSHMAEDEMFLITKGRLTMRFRDRDVPLKAGEFLIVPRGVEHLPVADGECEALLFEPASTLNTGNVTEARTVTKPDWI